MWWSIILCLHTFCSACTLSLSVLGKHTDGSAQEGTLISLFLDA